MSVELSEAEALARETLARACGGLQSVSGVRALSQRLSRVLVNLPPGPLDDGVRFLTSLRWMILTKSGILDCPAHKGLKC